MLPKLLTKLDEADNDVDEYENLKLRSGVPSNDPLPLLVLTFNPGEAVVVGRKMELLVAPLAM
jgi:hypothetical protein